MTENKTKKKITWTHNSIVKEIKKFIRFGYHVDSIINIMQKEVDENIMNHSSLADLCESVVSKYPNYELIQKVMRSKLIINVDEKADKYYMVDPFSDVVGTINALNCKNLFIKPDFSDKTYMADFTYNPYVLKKLYKEEGFYRFNTYNCPFWLIEHFFNAEPLVPCVIPDLYVTFLNHLTDGDGQSYNYILDWLATMLKDRNYCILSTIGNQGIGKGVLGSIMEKLVGKDNFSLTDNRLIKKEFNAQILNKRLVYIDELKVQNATEENRLKLLINDTIEVEKKGVDSINVRNFSSTYVSSNDFDAVRLRGDDRRFSIVDLTDKKLIDIMNQKEINALLAEENIDKLARYLWFRTVERRMNQVFISKRTALIRESALKGWEEWFIDDYCTKEGNLGDVLMTEVSDEIENIFGSRTRPSRKAFEKLRILYPERFKINRKRVDKGNGQQRLYFLSISKQEEEKKNKENII